MKALALSISRCWPTRLMVKILSPILNCSLHCLETGKMQVEARDPLLPKKTLLHWELEHNSFSLDKGSLFPSRKLKGNCTLTA